MAHIFQIRGTQLNAYYARFAASCGLLGTTPPAVAADATSGVFGSSVIQMNDASVLKALVYPGFTNLPSGSAFSVRWRIVPKYSGNPASNNVFWSMNGVGTGTSFGVEVIHVAATGLLNLRYQAISGAATNYTSGSAFVPVSGTPVDLMVSTDGTTTANGLKFSIDGVELGTATLNAAHTTFSNQLMRPAFQVGAGISTLISNYDLNDLDIWDTAESHTYSARTNFTTPPSVGELFPAASKVENNYAHYYTNAARTGTLGAGGAFTYVG